MTSAPPSRALVSMSARPWARALCITALLASSACKDAVAPEELPSCVTPGKVSYRGEEIPVAPSGYATVGNDIVNGATCKPMRFVGVGYPALSFVANGGRLGSEATAAADFAVIKSWGANTVRIELAQYYWVSTSRFFDPGYSARVERAVSLARAAGFDVILALQYSDRGIANYPGDPSKTNMHQPMPDVNHSVPFWRDVANRFKGDGRVMFELYSEPYPLSSGGGFSNWQVWLNGGAAPADDVYEPRPPFQAVGMQQLYDVVRATGANNLVLISGTQWGYDLSGVPTHRVKGYNIVYATHPWDFVDDKGQHQRPPSDFRRAWTFLAAEQPVMITEFGTYDCSTSYHGAALDEADRLGISWIAWAWQAPVSGSTPAQTGPSDNVCNFPMLLLDWSGTPSKTGAYVKGRMAAATK